MTLELCCLLWWIASPVPVPGFVALRVCSLKAEDQRGIVYLDPQEIKIIYQNRDAPKGCVKVVTSSGHGIFVHGSEHDIAEKRNSALREKRSFEGDEINP